MSERVDDGSNIPLQLGICCLWWHGGDTYPAVKNERGHCDTCISAYYVSDIE